MMRSLYSAVSGLQAHQTKMDVLANNIANVNTIGFKKGQVTFQDMLSQTMGDAQAGAAGVGGLNAQQIGLGVTIGSITNVHTQGAASTTGYGTDLMISGSGYFILQEGSNYYYSRAGAFSLDSAGNLVNSANGMLVCDSSGAPINIAGSDVSVAADGTLSYIDTGGAPQTGPQIGIAMFINPEGLKKVGENMYIETPASGAATQGAPGENASGSVLAGALEMSNVDLAQEFVDMIVAERGYQANAKTIKTADEMLQELINLKR